MIFLTVGTQFPFDRLVMAVDELFDHKLLDELVFAQVGETDYKPRNFEYATTLDKRVFDDMIRKSSGIISHAGVGTITMALEQNKALLVMPRLSMYNEVVNDHQVAIAERFEKAGLLLWARSERDLAVMVPRITSFKPKTRDNQLDSVVTRVSTFIQGCRK